METVDADLVVTKWDGCSGDSSGLASALSRDAS